MRYFDSAPNMEKAQLLLSESLFKPKNRSFFQGCKSSSNPYFCDLQMKTKSLQRAILLASGICAVLVILVSQSFYQTSSVAFKAKTEKSKDLPTGQAGKKEVMIHAPADVASQGHSVELNEQQPSHVEEELVLSDKKNKIVVYLRKTTLNFFKTLFPVIISPNAP